MLSEALLTRKAADCMIIDECGSADQLFSKMQGLKLLMVWWHSFLAHSDDVIESIFPKKGSQ